MILKDSFQNLQISPNFQDVLPFVNEKLEITFEKVLK